MSSVDDTKLKRYLLKIPHDTSVYNHDNQRKLLKELNMSYVLYGGGSDEYGFWLIACPEDKIPWVLLKTNGIIRERDGRVSTV